MNGRTCQLCGKPLSRIRVGAGEDFCSREHRNQYRLRQGMDRLLEANKVASLMRRRENPMPISPPRREGHAAVRGPDQPGARFSAGARRPILPASRWQPPARIPGERGPIQPAYHPPAAPRLREFGFLRHAIPGAVPGERPRKFPPPGAACLNRTRVPRPIVVAPRTGVALRVSSSAGFRLPKLERPVHRVAAPTSSVLAWKDRPHLPELGLADCGASVAVSGAPFAPPALGLADRGASVTVSGAPFAPPALRLADRGASVTVSRSPFAPPALHLPGVPEPFGGMGIRYPGAMPVNGHVARNGGEPGARSWGWLWHGWSAAIPQPIRHFVTPAGMPQFVAVPRAAADAMASRRLALVPLKPQEAARRPAAGQSQASQSETDPTGTNRTADSTAGTVLDEHFESGLKKWIGELENWSVDAAGVRAGSPAWFAPSLDMRDYELEFLTRIENVSVTWMFRASNPAGYHAATLAATPDGDWEFTRRTVIRGVPERSTAAPVRFSRAAGAALTVRQRAEGSRFAVFVDGQAIARWEDDRLPTGGIGFGGTSDDRARIYWVRISPLEAARKEPRIP